MTTDKWAISDEIAAELGRDTQDAAMENGIRADRLGAGYVVESLLESDLDVLEIECVLYGYVLSKIVRLEKARPIAVRIAERIDYERDHRLATEGGQ